MVRVPVLKNIMGANDTIAKELKEFFSNKGVKVINVLGTPGAGKTSFIEWNIKQLGDKNRIGVVEGDVASQVDADRLGKLGIPVVQINTGGSCHLNALMVREALKLIDITNLDILFIENVGNLICPANFSLGETLRIVILSVPEGDDKPKKYPVVFHTVDGVILNKIDVLEAFDYSVSAFQKEVEKINPNAVFFPVSCKSGEGLIDWIKWLKENYFIS